MSQHPLNSRPGEIRSLTMKGLRKRRQACLLLSPAPMTLELISEISGRAYRISTTAFGKVLHLSQQHGWQSESRDAGMILSQLERYMSGRFSRDDAEALRVALTRATATGAVAAERTLDFAAATLLEVSRRGAFQIRTVDSDAEEFSTSARQPAFASE